MITCINGFGLSQQYSSAFSQKFVDVPHEHNVHIKLLIKKIIYMIYLIILFGVCVINLCNIPIQPFLWYSDGPINSTYSTKAVVPV